MKFPPIYFLERSSGKLCQEKVYGERALAFLYQDALLSKALSFFIAKVPFVSYVYGLLQKAPWSKKKILPFIQEYRINQEEFLEDPTTFSSFNAFFCRKLKPEVRPLTGDEKTAVVPADGRFLVYPHIKEADGFVVKGKKFCLRSFLKDDTLSTHYLEGSLVIGRLCPSDYHRFHFPVTGIPGVPKLINGPLYSVNPIAIKQNLNILSENKRVITEIASDHFGKVLFIEVGATSVGSIHQTFFPNEKALRGSEKGYFSFGGSTIVLLFEKGAIKFEQDLEKASSEHLEVLCLMGQALGKKP